MKLPRRFARSTSRQPDRGQWSRNAIDPEIGYARMRDSEGEWLADFDPFKSGANKHYVEGNAWQLTFFVPQNVEGLADLQSDLLWPISMDKLQRNPELTQNEGYQP